MRAAGGSHKRQPHPIGGCRGAEPDGDSGSDSATSGEAAVARGKLADQLRAAGRAEGAVEAAFRRRDHGPGPAACAPRTALAGVVTV